MGSKQPQLVVEEAAEASVECHSSKPCVPCSQQRPGQRSRSPSRPLLRSPGGRSGTSCRRRSPSGSPAGRRCRGATCPRAARSSSCRTCARRPRWRRRCWAVVADRRSSSPAAGRSPRRTRCTRGWASARSGWRRASASRRARRRSGGRPGCSGSQPSRRGAASSAGSGSCRCTCARARHCSRCRPSPGHPRAPARSSAASRPTRRRAPRPAAGARPAASGAARAALSFSSSNSGGRKRRAVTTCPFC